MHFFHKQDSDQKNQYLVILARRVGFFSLFFQVLGQLYLCKKENRIPVVYFNRTCCFWSEDGYRGSRNVWEYYFEPLSNCSITDIFETEAKFLEGFEEADFERINSSEYIKVSSTYPSVIEWVWPDKIESQREFVYGLIREHIKIRKEIQDIVEVFSCRYFQGNKILGIHFRGIEKQREKSRLTNNLKKHYLIEIKQYLKKNLNAKLFIATDSSEWLSSLKADFGEKVLYRDITRLKKEEEVVGLHYSKYVSAKLGEEVLIDALLLSRCDFLIHGPSNVASAVLYFNPKLEHLDVRRKYKKWKFAKSVFKLIKRFFNAPA